MQPLRFALLLAGLLGACAHTPDGPSLYGVVAVGGPLAHARVTLRDHDGRQRSTRTDAQGHYRMDAQGLRAPLVLRVSDEDNGNCRYTNTPRAAVCLTALVPELAPGGTRANLNALTDQVSSDVALALHFTGPQQLAEAPQIPTLPAGALAHAMQQLREGFGAAVALAGVAEADRFDPLSTPMRADGAGVDALLDLIQHTRGYDNDTGEASATVLTDPAWRPLLAPYGDGANEPLQYRRAVQERQQLLAAPLRIFIIGDSTAATYERQRLPRMGWGQVFGEQFRSDSGVQVVNGARAGRSSRDFYNGGWYQRMLRYLKPGDYVFIAHGHNDQNCNARRPVRGAADVTNLCTYPNTPDGQRQFPAGSPALSFQSALETYIADARRRGAIPVLLTPTTRYLNAARRVAHWQGEPGPVVSQHHTRQNAAQGYAFVGDYRQTVQDTARTNATPLIDLEARTIAFANAHVQDWQDYWLVVRDTDRYPWYASQTAGTPAAPDTTHFQEAGARAVATLVAQGVREHPRLQELAGRLR